MHTSPTTCRTFYVAVVQPQTWLVSLIIIGWLSLATLSNASDAVTFERIVISEHFYSEGADFADFNADGHNDIVSGPFWYEGPDFRTRHRYMPGERLSIKSYSRHFFSFAHDFNEDGWTDILVIGMPGQPAAWYENPHAAVDGTRNESNTTEHWQSHFVSNDVGNESPTLTDITGDGRPELVCVHAGRFGYLEPDRTAPAQPWRFTSITQRQGFGHFTHGLGVADVDGDGRSDLLETHGWHQQIDVGKPFVEHPFRFAESGGSQMFAYDFDGDGDNDVVATQNAHAFGLKWFERRGAGDDELWVPHQILSDRPDSENGLPAISQMHAVALADMDGDGVRDIVTGKRFFAHNGGDPGAFQLPVLYWFRTVREPEGGVHFESRLIDNRVGVGTQLRVGDVDGDGRNDILVGNKLGTNLLLNRNIEGPESVPAKSGRTNASLPLSNAAPGTPDFARGVRESGPRSPSDEQASFVLPAGFEITLVASEPDIAKPLNMAFDARGRLWVTTTVEYPWPAREGEGRDSIVILEDRDGDGRAEQITTFADGLNIPIGLYPYGDGVVCYSIPNIWYLRDTDGDGKCDVREKLYGPFDYSRDAHGMCNAFLRGYDGWLYACHGFNNQSSVTGGDGNTVVMHSGNTFRMRLDGSRIEHYTHGQVNPFGMAYDARGDLLTADCHTKPVTLLLQGGYYDSFGKPHDGLGFVPDVMQHLHGSTAIGGIAISTDGVANGSTTGVATGAIWPEEYISNTFGGNVMTSRINRNSLIYRGSSVVAQEEPDLLISADSWFRPVDLKFGPDGSLYVADFYNRIIGHYEVPLQHPGRDRESGRIWKITWRGDRSESSTGSPSRLTRSSSTLADSVQQASRDELLSLFDSPSHTIRMLALDRLTDHIGQASISSLREAFRRGQTINRRLHCLWGLHRLDAVTAEEIDTAISAHSALIRSHAFRLLSEMTSSNAYSDKPGFSEQQIETWLILGLEDDDRLVNRAAAMAATHFSTSGLTSSLFLLQRTIPSDDVHLRHAVRMALRHQLRDAAIFQRLKKQVRVEDVPLLAGICLALKSREAAEFLAENIPVLAERDPDRLGEYIRLALNGVTDETAKSIVAIARTKFAGDTVAQIEMLNALRAGRSSDSSLPQATIEWAVDLARQLLDVDCEFTPIPWTNVPHGDSAADNAWSVSERRKSADTGDQPTRLWSSFPGGEQRTGIYRSGAFELPAQFQFFIAGHDGTPGQPMLGKNLIRLLDRNTDELLQQWSPPRNDTAQSRSWDTGEHAGRQVYVELVDGDTASAYAWIAVGRFNVSGLNPNRLIRDRRLATELIRDFRLTKLESDVASLLTNRTTDGQTRADMAKTLVSFAQDPHLMALATSLASPALPIELQQEVADQIAASRWSMEMFEKLSSFGTLPDHRRMALELVGKRESVSTLTGLVRTGKLNPQVLLDPVVSTRLDAVATAQQKSMVEELVSELGQEDSSMQALIDARIANWLAKGGDVNNGRIVFEGRCAVCHQVAGMGRQVGPNLDGIGNRGVHRVVEDTLAPNRNVDVAFRASTLVTNDGRVLTGLIKSEDDTSLTLVDTTGKPMVIAKSDIDVRNASVLSPMPGNFAEVLGDVEYRDLVSYLMNLNR